ncbi:MAG: fused MFS/spermidine synthase [Nannocystaceae bacterium]
MGLALGALSFASACGSPPEPVAVDSQGADKAASRDLPAPSAPLEVEGNKLLARAEGTFSKIRIRQQGTRRTMVFVRERGGEFPQTVIDLRDPDRLHHPYAEAVAAAMLFRPDPARILIVGLGGGTLIRFFHRFLPASQVDTVEIDPEVVRLAARWFGVVERPGVHLITEDGVHFLAGEGERYDLIVLDAFLDPGRPGTDATGIPEELRGLGFLRRVKARLNPGGVAAFNIHFKSGFREHVDAIAEVFPQVQIAPVRNLGQRIIYASVDASPEITAEVLAGRAAELDAKAEWGLSFAEWAAVIQPWTRTTPGAGAPTPPPTPATPPTE